MSYILSGFFYSTLEEEACSFLRREYIDPIDSNNTELNLLMRLTDDYLLITTKENNGLVLIDKLLEVSNQNNFKFNMKKLKTNFPVNLT